MGKLKKWQVTCLFVEIFCALILLSVVGSVIASQFVQYEGYIGRVSTIGNYNDNGTVFSGERMNMEVFSDPDFENYIGGACIITGGDYGNPTALISTVISAKAHGERVRIIIDNSTAQIRTIFGLVDSNNTLSNIIGLINDVQDTSDGIYSQVIGHSGSLQSIYNLTNAVDQHVAQVYNTVNLADQHVAQVSSQVQGVDAHLSSTTTTLNNHLSRQDTVLNRIWNAVRSLLPTKKPPQELVN